MRLYIKQHVFAWTDSFDIYDENERVIYRASAEFLSLGHQLHVYDQYGDEVGVIRQQLLTLMPTFNIEQNGVTCGQIRKRFSLFAQNYYVDYYNWYVQGNFLGWDYRVEAEGRFVAQISKEPFHWGDTYVIDIVDPSDTIDVLMLVLAIDCANCTDK